MKKIPKIAIIGRANVGKSTLFNTLAEKRKAIVSNIAGTTRDRNYAIVEWQNTAIQIIDTGGIDIVHPKDIEKDILRQAEVARNEAEIVLFLVDAKSGLMPQDKEIALLLKKSHRPIILAANKADNKQQKENLAEFYKLNVGEPLAISALSGTGTGDLLDVIVAKLQNKLPQASSLKPQTSNLNQIKIAIIGKPNVGKSTLVNAILNEERMITSSEPYTTRDSQDIDFNFNGQNYLLIDTAGVRKHAKISSRLEKFSVGQALESIAKSDITLLITDASESLGQQDKALADEILSNKASLIIVANKWDKIKAKDSQTINKYTDYYRRFFPFLNFAPIIFTSGLEKQRVIKILELASEIYLARQKQITDNALDKFLKKLIKKHPAAKGKGVKHPKLYQLKQLDINPPQFEILKDYTSDLNESYLRFIENQLRQKFEFLGTPVIIKVRRLKR